MRWTIFLAILCLAAVVLAEQPAPTPVPTPANEAAEAERKLQDEKVIEINRYIAEIAGKLKVDLPKRPELR